MSDSDKTTLKGWECPRCNEIISPYVATCGKCSPAEKGVWDLLDYTYPTDSYPAAWWGVEPPYPYREEWFTSHLRTITTTKLGTNTDT